MVPTFNPCVMLPPTATPLSVRLSALEILGGKVSVTTTLLIATEAFDTKVTWNCTISPGLAYKDCTYVRLPVERSRINSVAVMVLEPLLPLLIQVFPEQVWLYPQVWAKLPWFPQESYQYKEFPTQRSEAF